MSNFEFIFKCDKRKIMSAKLDDFKELTPIIKTLKKKFNGGN